MHLAARVHRPPPPPFHFQPVAQALAAMLKRAEPPICVGLYARWGSGKTFMISLLKKEFDPDVREDPRTRQLLQFFEEGYDELGPAQAPAEETISSLIRSLLLTILLSFVPTIPYGVMTFFSMICDAFDPSEVLKDAWAWCSKLKKACGKKAVVVDGSLGEVATDERADAEEGYSSKERYSSGVDHTEKPPWWKAILTGLASLYEKLPQADEQTPKKDVKEKDTEKEFIFVDFNAWECAA
jgi:hypothetical protein